MIIDLNIENFDDIINSNTRVVIEVWASWCAPCKMIAPIFKELSEEFDGKIVFAKIDAEDNMNIIKLYGISNVPTFLYMKNGSLIEKSVGAITKNVLSEKLNNLIDFKI